LICVRLHKMFKKPVMMDAATASSILEEMRAIAAECPKRADDLIGVDADSPQWERDWQTIRAAPDYEAEWRLLDILHDALPTIAALAAASSEVDDAE
jgi:hypothetical protein